MRTRIKKLSQSINQMHSFIYIRKHKATTKKCKEQPVTPTGPHLRFTFCNFIHKFCSWKSFCAHLILISAISSMFIYFYSAVCHRIAVFVVAVLAMLFLHKFPPCPLEYLFILFFRIENDKKNERVDSVFKMWKFSTMSIEYRAVI